MRANFYGSTLADLFNWSNTFATTLQVDPTSVFITPQQATDYTVLNASWASLYQQCLSQETRTRVLLQQRDLTKASLLAMAKNLVANIGTNPQVTNPQRTALGVPIRKSPTPQPTPIISPTIEVLSVVARTVTARLIGSVERRGLPPFVHGSSVFSHTGETAPLTIEGWKFEGNYTKATFTIPFAPSPTSSTVWVTAFFFNARAISGPACQPISINLPASNVVPVGAKIKRAA